MRSPRRSTRFLAASMSLLLFGIGESRAQTYTSGSSGVDGPLAPIANTTLAMPATGIFHFTTVNIPVGVTVTFTPNAANTPVTLLATGAVTINGTISVNGQQGIPGSTSGPAVNPGGAGGPGGFRGGQGGSRGTANGPASAGQGPGGGLTCVGGTTSCYGTYGAPSSFTSLLPLFGGSGGAGQSSSTLESGSSGGGGGGAIVMASSSSITVNGIVQANGAPGKESGSSATISGAGSGGAIRLVAPQIQGIGTLQAICASTIAVCDRGRIRLEAFMYGFEGASDPLFSASVAPGPVTAAGLPGLANLPTVTMISVGGVSNAPVPGGIYSTADIALPAGTTNPISVALAATNMPVGTVFTVRAIPQFAPAVDVSSTPTTGTFASSTATASLTLPTGLITVLNVFASIPLPPIAGFAPAIDGEPVDRILVAASYGESSQAMWLTPSGRMAPVSTGVVDVMHDVRSAP